MEGTYYAIGDTCTHRGGPLSEGDVQGTKVTCPWHGAHFDLKTGAVLLLKPRATKQELLRAMDGHILAEAQLSGTYQRKR